MEQFWFGVPSWPERNSGGMLSGIIEWFYLRRHDVTDYIHDVMNVRFEEILNYFENESRSVLIGFGKCENIRSERFSGKNRKNTTVFPWKHNESPGCEIFVKKQLIVISAVFAPFLRLCAAR